VFPMSLPDLVRAHQKDVDRRLERATVAYSLGAYDAGDAGPTGRLTSLLAGLGRHLFGRAGGRLAPSHRPEPGPVPLLSRDRRPLTADKRLAAAGDDRCGDCNAAVG